MDRFPPFNTLLLWGATFYLATHGVLPPAATEAEARELAVALREASVAWVGSRVRALRSWVSVLLAG
ncbi:MAG TPA: hypothetical protein VJX71_09305 [Methylomirabilota bacterium]|nr:hypothetical protein [Methylomirabilota bacterium]